MILDYVLFITLSYFSESRIFGRSNDNRDFSSFAFTECTSSLADGLGGVVGNKADFNFGRVGLIGDGFFMPCLLAKSDFTLHKGSLSAETKKYHKDQNNCTLHENKLKLLTIYINY